MAMWVTSLALPHIPEGKTPPYFWEANIGAALWVGWMFLGSRVGRGYRAAVGFGLTAGVMVMVVALFVHSSEEMLRRALSKRYDGAMEALVSIFQIGMDMAVMLASPTTVAALLAGGVAAAFVTEWVGVRFT